MIRALFTHIINVGLDVTTRESRSCVPIECHRLGRLLATIFAVQKCEVGTSWITFTFGDATVERKRSKGTSVFVAS